MAALLVPSPCLGLVRASHLIPRLGLSFLVIVIGTLGGRAEKDFQHKVFFLFLSFISFLNY